MAEQLNHHPALGARSLTTGPPRKSPSLFLYKIASNDSKEFALCPVHGGEGDGYRVPERKLGTEEVTKEEPSALKRVSVRICAFYLLLDDRK